MSPAGNLLRPTHPTFCTPAGDAADAEFQAGEIRATVYVLAETRPLSVPVLPQGKPITPCLENWSGESLPPPCESQEFCWRALRPNGTAEKIAEVGSLPTNSRNRIAHLDGVLVVASSACRPGTTSPAANN